MLNVIQKVKSKIVSYYRFWVFVRATVFLLSLGVQVHHDKAVFKWRFSLIIISIKELQVSN